MSVISLRGVEKQYHQRALFTDVNLTVKEGTAVGIQGTNGSGKSVLLRIMTQFVLPDAGTVEIAPRFLSPRRMFPEGFGIIIDRPGFIPSQTGLQNLMSLAKIRGVIGESKVRNTMALVGLDPALPQKTRHYSLGMKQRLGLAQAIMEDQPIMVLDEPFNGIDAESIPEIRDLLRSLVDEGRTLIITSHDQEDITTLCDEAYRFSNARLNLWKNPD